MTERPVAHLAEDGRVHGLEEHSRETAELASRFAAEFGCAGWGRLTGLWHDLGKFSSDFQRYIRAAGGIDGHVEGRPGRVDHSTAGGLHALDKFDKLGRVFAYLIAGHHAGLPDWQGDWGASLAQRLENSHLLQAAVTADIPNDILEQALPPEG